MNMNIIDRLTDIFILLLALADLIAINHIAALVLVAL